jgi:peptidyl-tRNA hydrolase, PTH1 family
MVVDRLAADHRAKYFWPRFSGRAVRITLGPEEVTLLKPHTFMNNSGVSVAAAMKKLNLYSDQLIVVHDDLDLPLGRLRIGIGLSSGGHKGLQSIIDHLGTKDFIRVRLGIGHPEKQDVVDYVLEHFSGEEKAEADKMIEEACRAVETLVAGTLEKAQNIYNKRN